MGYEYEYDFSVDDEIAKRCRYDIAGGETTLLFEMRIVFIIKKTCGKKSVIDGETYYGQLNVVDDVEPLGRERQLLAMGLEDEVNYRLPGYWMPRDLIRTFNLDAIDFARETTAADPERASDVVIPIAAHVKVCTV